jgi:hypothetical protein
VNWLQTEAAELLITFFENWVNTHKLQHTLDIQVHELGTLTTVQNRNVEKSVNLLSNFCVALLKKWQYIGTDLSVRHENLTLLTTLSFVNISL